MPANPSMMVDRWQTPIYACMCCLLLVQACVVYNYVGNSLARGDVLTFTPCLSPFCGLERENTVHCSDLPSTPDGHQSSMILN